MKVKSMKYSRIILSTAMVTLLVASASAPAADRKARPEIARNAEGAPMLLDRQIEGAPQTSPNVNGTPTKAWSAANCLSSTVACGITAYGYRASCVAIAVASDGAAAPLSAACLAYLSTVTLSACSAMAYYCAGGTGGAPTYSPPPGRALSSVGDWTGDGTGPDFFSDAICGTNTFVDSVTVRYNSTRVTGVSIRCTPSSSTASSTTMNRGYNGTASNTYTCPNGQLMAGLLVRAGQEIDAAGGVCRKVSNSDVSTFVNGLWGGSGGTRQDRVCAPNQDMYGVKFQLDGSNETSPNVIGMQPLCR